MALIKAFTDVVVKQRQIHYVRIPDKVTGKAVDEQIVSAIKKAYLEGTKEAQPYDEFAVPEDLGKADRTVVRYEAISPMVERQMIERQRTALNEVKTADREAKEKEKAERKKSD